MDIFVVEAFIDSESAVVPSYLFYFNMVRITYLAFFGSNGVFIHGWFLTSSIVGRFAGL